MDKTLIFVGSSRRGTTFNFANAYAKHLKSGFDLVRYKNTMQPCMGCRKCVHYGGSLPQCVINDPLSDLFKLWNYSKVVLCSPVYCFYLSAQAKTFIDRFVINPIEGTKLGLILVGGDSFENNRASNIIATLETFCDYFEPKLQWGGFVYKRTHDRICRPGDVDREMLKALAAKMGETIV